MKLITTILADIRSVFAEAAVPENAGPMQAYMKNIAPFLGLKAPRRRILQKEIFLHHQHLAFGPWQELIRLLWQQPEREFHYLAMDWLWQRRRTFRPETIQLIEALLTAKSWWDTVDFLASRCLGEWARRFPEAATPVLARYIQNNNFWLVRSAILHQLHYKRNTNEVLLVAAIKPHLQSKEFFICKAIGWALRQYARTAPDWVVDFVETHPEMQPLSRREALKHL